MTATSNQLDYSESLCCNARIDELFSICRDCGEHAVPTRYIDGSPVNVDIDGYITESFDNDISFADRFKRDFNADTETLTALCLLIISVLVIYGLTGLVGGVK